MTKIDRRDFLLHVAPLIAAPALILGSVEEMEAQIKNFALQTPTQNAQFNVGQTVQISVGLIRTFYPKITRINFKANGQTIGTSSNRPYQMNWQPTQAGNFTLTAEAVLSNGGVVTSISTVVSVASSQLEVLYDTLGSVTTGWGWAGEAPYTTIFNRSLGTNYFVTTSYIGSIPLPKTLRRIELALYGGNTVTRQNYDMTYFINFMWFAVWNGNISTFYQQPIDGSVARVQLPVPSLGSMTVPFIQNNQDPVYVIGWENLNIALPANVPLEMSFQFEGIQLGDLGSIYGSNISNTGMRFASSGSSGNGVWNRPMAFRAMVSN